MTPTNMTDTRGAVDRYLLFSVGAEEFGIAVAAVSGVVRYEDPTPVPRSQEGVLGVINLRGRVVPVVDVAQVLEIERKPVGVVTRIVVTEMPDGPVGLLVDAASEVALIPPEEIGSTPEAAISDGAIDLFVGVTHRDERLIVILRLDRLVPRLYSDHNVREGGGDV